MNICYESTSPVSCPVFAYGLTSGVLSLGFSLVPWIVTIFGFVVLMSCVSSVILFLMPFMLSCRILKSLDLVEGCLRVEVLEEEEEVLEEEDWVGDGGESLSVVVRWSVEWVELVVWLGMSESVEDEVVEVSE